MFDDSVLLEEETPSSLRKYIKLWLSRRQTWMNIEFCKLDTAPILRKTHKFAMMSIPKQAHIPPRINREDFQAGYMKPLSYSLEDISSAIVDHLSREELTERQLEGLAKFKSNGGWTYVNPEDPDNLKKWFEILNSVFFNGILSDYCSMSSTLSHACSWGRVGL